MHPSAMSLCDRCGGVLPGLADLPPHLGVGLFEQSFGNAGCGSAAFLARMQLAEIARYLVQQFIDLPRADCIRTLRNECVEETALRNGEIMGKCGQEPRTVCPLKGGEPLQSLVGVYGFEL